MTATSDAVDDSVPFILADLVQGGATFAKVREVRSARLIDYQVAGEGGEMPKAFSSFRSSVTWPMRRLSLRMHWLTVHRFTT